MSEDEVIDAEVVEIEEAVNLPAVIEAEGTHAARTPIEGRDWSRYSSPERQCTASSSRTGARCKNAAIRGSSVCRYHGGAAKQVKQAARIRLENAADLMAKQLLGIALTADSEGVKLAAIRDALDRAGLKAPSEVVLSQGESRLAFETVFDSIGGNPPDESSDPSSSFGSAGLHASPASAYDQYADGVQAEAGGGVTRYGDTGQQDADFSADVQAEPSSRDGSARQGRPRDNDRDRGHRRPAHITGEAAIRAANEANRAIGAMADQLAIETNHKRYLRP